LTDAMSIEGASFGMLYVPSNFDGTDLLFHVCSTVNGTYLPLLNDAGVAIQYVTAASKAVALPPELFGAAYFKIETVTDQATSDTVFLVTTKG
jgi:hypothetical protein